MNDYYKFLKSKEVVSNKSGFDINESDVSKKLFDFQNRVVVWAVNKGKPAIFSGCGTGKTPMQLEYSRIINEKTNKPVLILAPLAVSMQTKEEGEKFDINVNVCNSQSDVKNGINITNYEKMQHFDMSCFSGIVLDESSCLKNYTSKIKKSLISTFMNTKYKLACTATPAPNDHMELGNHSEFLNVMNSNEMLSRWFVLDTMSMGKYRVKQHAVNLFWKWVASWACCFNSPEDLGYKDDRFKLPKLNINKINIIENELELMMNVKKRRVGLSATTMHKELRKTCKQRAEKTAEILSNDTNNPWVVWCNTNYEADELIKLIPEAIEVRGSMTPKKKEELLMAFSHGKERIIISKPSIAGFGMNWQHCNNTVFVGLSYSFEMYYQALRRLWRFGQTKEVNAYFVQSPCEKIIAETVNKKEIDHNTMNEHMSKANFIHEEQSANVKIWQESKNNITLPSWIN